MEAKNNNAKQNKKLYACLVGVLVCLAVIVGVTTAVSKNKEHDALVRASDELESNSAIIDNYNDGIDDVWFENDKNKETGEGQKLEENVGDNTASLVSDEEVPANATETDAVIDADAEETAVVEQPAGTNSEKIVSTDGEIPTFTPPVGGAVIVSFSDVTPVFSVTMNDYRTHPAVDIEAESGSAIAAAADGVIGAVWDDPMMGKCITVVHSGGAVSTYKGVYETLPEGITEGAWVSSGQVIAAVGDSALQEIAEESHVHYELSVGGQAVDPAKYIDFTAVMNYED